MQKILRLPVFSTVDIQSIFNRQLANTSVLPLEAGSLEGSVEVLPLENIKLFRITANKKIAVCADRSHEKLLFSVDLNANVSSEYIEAQGVSITRPAVFGFNSQLKDLDLKLPSSSLMCSIVVPIEQIISRADELLRSDILDLLNSFNVVSSSSISSSLISLLHQCWEPANFLSPQLLEDEILEVLIDSLLGREFRKVARPLSRQDRQTAAISVLSLINSMPEKQFEIQDLSRLLHQSRTSLFNGCKEKFGMSPVQVVRSVRLHQVRHALSNVEFGIQNNINSVDDAAQYFGFVGRSHFARYYKNQFMETPRQTLARRKNREKVF